MNEKSTDKFLYKCNKCGNFKESNNFHVDKSIKRGFRAICKECKNKSQREYWVKLKLGAKMKNKEQLISEFHKLKPEQKRVYECIPFNAYASLNVVFSEAKRQGMNRSINDLKRICKELVENGFALEDKNGHFMSLNINKTKEEKMVEKQKEFDAKIFGSNAKILRNQAAQFDVYSASIRKLADDLELCVVYILELEEKLKNANENNDKEYKAFLAFKAAIGH